VRSWIDHAGEVVWEPAPSLIAQLIEEGQPFWLDIEDPTDEIVDQLATRLGLHPLAIEGLKTGRPARQAAALRERSHARRLRSR